MQKLKEDIKQKIIEVGKLHFKKQGYENTSMKDIASDVGISTGNIYRYFLTKKHLLGEILKEIEVEIEELFDKIPSNYSEINLHETFNLLVDSIINMAETKKDTLKVMFNSTSEKQFIELKEKTQDMIVHKMMDIAKSMKSGEIDQTLCEAISRAEFEGFVWVVKNNIDDLDKLKKNLEIYEKLMIENLGEKAMEVIENDRKIG